MQSKLTEKELLDIFQWDVKNWSNVLPFWEEHFDFKPGAKVLALGEREGGLSLYFAKKGCKVVCSDYKEFPEETKSLHESYGVSHLIEYHKVDMSDIQCVDGEFDVVVFKSVLGALETEERQKKAVSEIFRVLKKGGVLLFAENLKGSWLHQFLRNNFVTWANRWRYLEADEMMGWLSQFSKKDIQLFGFLGVIGRTEKQRSFFGGIDRYTKRLIPKKWRYILFGCVTK